MTNGFTIKRNVKTVDQIVSVAVTFKLLSDPTRLKILCLLYKKKDGMCVYEIADEVGSSHSAISHQLAKLEDRGIVESFREGQKVCYKIFKNGTTKNVKAVLNIFKCSYEND